MAAENRFVEKHHLYTEEQQAASAETLALVKSQGVEVIRLVWPDQYGLLRGRSVTPPIYSEALVSGVDITMAPFFFDTANAIVINPFQPGGGFDMPELQGSPNVRMVPDPKTFRILPWAPDTGWVICDLYMQNGEPFPFAPRQILRDALAKVDSAGFRFMAGIEMEWYLTRILDDRLVGGSLGAPGNRGDAPIVAPVARGYSHLSDAYADEVSDALRPIRQALTQLGLPVRTFDDEWAPSQMETTLGVLEGLDAADGATLLRMTIKQVARRNGYLASFMCTPAITGFYASGWHLHSSLVDAKSGDNVMVPDEGETLSETGRYYVGGTLAHAGPASVFTTQSVNGYRRRRPYSLAPDRLTWGHDNRAAMMRVISAPGDSSSHVENRVGEPAANPYLYMAAQAVSGLDGIMSKIDPGPISDDPYSEDVAILPQSLEASVQELQNDPFFRSQFGDRFIDYIVTMKNSEVARYNAWCADNPDASSYVNGITDWEHREYFELF